MNPPAAEGVEPLGSMPSTATAAYASHSPWLTAFDWPGSPLPSPRLPPKRKLPSPPSMSSECQNSTVFA